MATTHGGGLEESFEVGNPCPETHRYALVSTFLERMNARLAMSHRSGQRARSGMDALQFCQLFLKQNFCVAQCVLAEEAQSTVWARVQVR